MANQKKLDAAARRRRRDQRTQKGQYKTCGGPWLVGRDCSTSDLNLRRASRHVRCLNCGKLFKLTVHPQKDVIHD